jgi:hypothetical protein
MQTSCPVESTDTTPHSSYNSLTVHVIDSSTTDYVSAFACLENLSCAGGSCGTGDDTSGIVGGTGHDALTPSVGVWQSDFNNNFPYVYVYLPAASGSNTSKVLGLFDELV